MYFFLQHALHALPGGDETRLEPGCESQAAEWLDGQTRRYAKGPWLIMTGHHIRSGDIAPADGSDTFNDFGDNVILFNDDSAVLSTALDGETLLLAPVAFRHHRDEATYAWIATALDWLRTQTDPLKMAGDTFCESGEGHWLTNVGKVGHPAFSVPCHAEHDALLVDWLENLNLILSLKCRQADANNAIVTVLGRRVSSHGTRTRFSSLVQLTSKPHIAKSTELSAWVTDVLTHLSDTFPSPMAGVAAGRVWYGSTPKAANTAAGHDLLKATKALMAPLPDTLIHRFSEVL